MEQNGTFWFPPQSSTTAAEVDAVFYYVYWTSFIIFAAVGVFIVYFAWKYRRRSPADRPVEVKPSVALELSWIIVPALLVMVAFWWGMKVFINVTVAPPHAYEVQVTAHKWRWDFEYPNGRRSTNELYVPVGEPVRLVMTSSDVIHSFFVPAFRVKHDAVPNRYTSVWFEVPEPGEYQVLCAEYCGTLHSEMYAKVIAVERAEFNEWLRAGGEAEGVSLPELGEQLYQQQACFTCHSVDGSPGVGPTWLGIWDQDHRMTDGTVIRVDENYLVESIVDPNAHILEGYQPVMPPYPNLSERELAALVAYIKQINGAWDEAEEAEAEETAAEEGAEAEAEDAAAEDAAAE